MLARGQKEQPPGGSPRPPASVPYPLLPCPPSVSPGQPRGPQRRPGDPRPLRPAGAARSGPGHPEGPRPRPRPARAAQNREAAVAAATVGTVRGVAAAGLAAGRAERHGGSRAPRLRAQDQQVVRPPGPLPGRPHVSEPRPGAARPSLFWAPPIQAPSALASSGPLPPAGGAGVGRWGGRGGSGLGVAEGLRARWWLRSSLGTGGTRGGVPGGPSWRRRRGESAARRPPRVLPISWPLPRPPSSSSVGVGGLFPSHPLGLVWGRDASGAEIWEQDWCSWRPLNPLGKFPVIFSPRGSRAQLSGGQGTAVNVPRPQPCFRLSQHRLDALEMDGD